MGRSCQGRSPLRLNVTPEILPSRPPPLLPNPRVGPPPLGDPNRARGLGPSSGGGSGPPSGSESAAGGPAGPATSEWGRPGPGGPCAEGGGTEGGGVTEGLEGGGGGRLSAEARSAPVVRGPLAGRWETGLAKTGAADTASSRRTCRVARDVVAGFSPPLLSLFPRRAGPGGPCLCQWTRRVVGLVRAAT